MRISLKWLLVTTAYVAVAVAACVQQGPILQTCLWLVTLFAVLYSVLAVAFFRGRARAVAAGFALFATSAFVVFYTSSSSPIAPVVQRYATDSVVSPDEMTKAAARLERLAWEIQFASSAANKEYRDRTEQEYDALLQRVTGLSSFEALVAGLEMVLVMASGIVGGLVGAHVWGVARRSEATPMNDEAEAK